MPLSVRLQALVVAAFCCGAHAASEHHCAAVAEPSARLRCFDEAFPAPKADAPDAVNGQPAFEELESEFGLSSRELEERKPEALQSQRVQRIRAVVVEARAASGGQRIVVLDNGQIWRITDGGSRGPLASGDEVGIRRQLSGSYLLTTPGGVGLRVRRLQ